VTNGDLRYIAKPMGSAFQAAQTLDATGVTGRYTAIAVDSTGRVHLAYQDATNQDVRYITKANGASSFAAPITVLATGTVGHFISLAVSATNDVAITHYENTGDNLALAEKASSASAFTNTVVDATGNAGAYSAVKYAPNGALHIAYGLIVPTNIGGTTYNYYDLRHAVRASGASTFVLSTIDGPNNQNSGSFISLAASPAGVMHVLYHDATSTDLRHQHRCP
ncbi:MAG TPA: hypothetical protein VGD87_14115, partial [Archangium sp.]